MTLISLPFKSPSINFGLHSGAASGNLGLVKFALDNGQAIDSCVKGLLPIHAACAYGHVQVVKYLLERGADVNARRRPRRYSASLIHPKTSKNGTTALHFAVASGNVELVSLLLKWGAKADVVDKYGSTPHSIAVAKQNSELSALLEDHLVALSKHSSTPSLQNCVNEKSELASPPALSPGLTSPPVPLLNIPSDEEKSYTESDSDCESEYPLEENNLDCLAVNLPVFPRSRSDSDLTKFKEQTLSGENKHKSNIRRFFRMYNKSSLLAAHLRE